MYDNNNRGWKRVNRGTSIESFLYFMGRDILFEGRLAYVKDIL